MSDLRGHSDLPAAAAPAAPAGEPASPWLLWQLADSAFPSGGFAHSGGLEAAWQLGEVDGRDGLAAFAQHSIDQCAQSSLPFVTAAWTAEAPFAEIDQMCDAMLTNHVMKRSSRALGHGLLASAVAAFASSHPAIAELKLAIRGARLPGHLASVFGALTACLGSARVDGQRLFLYLHLRGLLSSAVRLGMVGPLEAQGLQHRLAPGLESARLRNSERPCRAAASSAPLLDLYQGHHDRLYSRLFSS